MDEDAECAEVRDSLNYSLLQLQRYFRTLRSRNLHLLSTTTASLTNGDGRSVGQQQQQNGGGLLGGHSLRLLSPMTPFKDAPDKFLWRWIDMEAIRNGAAGGSGSSGGGVTLPARLDKEASNVPAVLRAARQSDNTVLVQLLERGLIFLLIILYIYFTSLPSK